MAKTFRVLKLSNVWSTEKLRKEVEDTLNRVSKDGWEIVSVAFGSSNAQIATAMITISK
ncbi:hypothetical protein [Aquimarina spongiae]|uniref:DUF4177 domain-containing protein n=1 Tax=Aquimarina spongiae TaxID=570521 RepID=A0A1M6FCF8_9FLAO|nr:hypothetical protein [Aquimarina spongiae]SHI95357.1 hypothetical protein SAMN04488508_104209 [Aquimarina spongiae]